MTAKRPDSTPTMQPVDQLLYTPAEAAVKLGRPVKESWLRRQAGTRAIPSTKVSGHLMFSEADLAEIVRLHARPAETTRRRRPYAA